MDPERIARAIEWIKKNPKTTRTPIAELEQRKERLEKELANCAIQKSALDAQNEILKRDLIQIKNKNIVSQFMLMKVSEVLK